MEIQFVLNPRNHTTVDTIYFYCFHFETTERSFFHVFSIALNKKGNLFKMLGGFGDDPFVTEQELLYPEAHLPGVDRTEEFMRSFLTKVVRILNSHQVNLPKHTHKAVKTEGRSHSASLTRRKSSCSTTAPDIRVYETNEGR